MMRKVFHINKFEQIFKSYLLILKFKTTNFILFLVLLIKFSRPWSSERIIKGYNDNYIQGNIKEDNEIRKSIAQVFADLKEASFVPLTDKDLVKTMKKQRFVDIIQPTFLNITRLINCVSWEKWKLHSKIEFNGLSAAMKILFPERNELYLSRNELVGLVSLISKLSDSITW